MDATTITFTRRPDQTLVLNGPFLSSLQECDTPLTTQDLQSCRELWLKKNENALRDTCHPGTGTHTCSTFNIYCMNRDCKPRPVEMRRIKQGVCACKKLLFLTVTLKLGVDLDVVPCSFKSERVVFTANVKSSPHDAFRMFSQAFTDTSYYL